MRKLRTLSKQPIAQASQDQTFDVHVALVRQHEVEAVLSQSLFPLFDPPVPVVLLLLHVWREREVHIENKVRIGGVGR